MKTRKLQKYKSTKVQNKTKVKKVQMNKGSQVQKLVQ